MQWDIPGKLFIQTAEEPKKLLMPMPLITLADHLALQHI